MGKNTFIKVDIFQFKEQRRDDKTIINNLVEKPSNAGLFNQCHIHEEAERREINLLNKYVDMGTLSTFHSGLQAIFHKHFNHPINIIIIMDVKM